MKPFRFFMKRRPEWLDISKFGEIMPIDVYNTGIVGVSPLCYDPENFNIKRRAIFWSESKQQHLYGPWLYEDDRYFNLPEIQNPIRPNE
jgi:hypothetical protein